MNRILRQSLLTTLLAAPLGHAVPASAKPVREVKLYLVALDDGGKTGRKFGCGDSLVAVNRTINPTSTPLTAAIKKLLQEPRSSNALPLLNNYWFGPDLQLKTATVSHGTARIHFSGNAAVAGVCDEPRITEQIEAIARQFPTVKRVKVWVGNEKLADAIR